MVSNVHENIDKLHKIVDSEQVKEEILHSLRGLNDDMMKSLLSQQITRFEEGKIYSGHIVRCTENEVVVDIGYKGEGFINREEFDSLDDIQPGDTVDVLLDAFDENTGEMVLSKRKADRIRGWETVINKYGLGDVVSGRVVRKIKGGLLVDIGVQVFLPASQVDIRRIPDIGEFVGRDIEAKIIKIDPNRRNIVLSRRQMLEEKRDKMKESLLSELKEGERRVGEVKNITDFGAFVDLGGIDGLLHIVDMSWQRVNHPSNVVSIGEKIEVVILKIDLQRERISVSLKHKTPSPWENIEERFPIGSIHTGKIVNIMPYGAFVQLEEGIEGLVHVSEMSWTKQINHPSEIVSVGNPVDVVILGVNHDKKEISLGMKQTERNPWETLDERFPPGTIIEGVVKNIVNYGAFIELEEGIEGLLHVSDMSWTKKITNPGSIVKKGESIKAQVTAIDAERKRISLSMKHLEDNPWDTVIPHRYIEGSVIKGIITNIAEKGIFVDIGDVEAFMPHSEVSHQRIPATDLLDPGDEVDVKVLSINIPERSIRLSMREVSTLEDEQERLREKKEARKAAAEAAEKKAKAKEEKKAATTKKPKKAKDESAEGEGEAPEVGQDVKEEPAEASKEAKPKKVKKAKKEEPKANALETKEDAEAPKEPKPKKAKKAKKEEPKADVTEAAVEKKVEASKEPKPKKAKKTKKEEPEVDAEIAPPDVQKPEEAKPE